MAASAPNIYQESFQTLPPKLEKSFPGWFEDLRREACERFRQTGFPDRRHESWRYINLEPLLKTAYGTAESPQLDASAHKTLESFFLDPASKNRWVYLNGFFSEELSGREDLPEGALVENFSTVSGRQSEILRPYLASGAQSEENPFSSINTFSFKEGIFIFLPPGTKLQTPLHLLLASVRDRKAYFVYYPRILVVIGEGAELDLVVDHAGLTDASYFMNAVAELHLGKNAKCRLVCLQREGYQAFHFLKTHSFLSRGSRLESVSFTEGGKVTRQETIVDFREEGATCHLSGLSLLHGDSRFYQHAVVNHLAGSCQSDQLFKNILSGQSQAESNSLVHVIRHAQKSESHQLIRNLLLSLQARALSRPQLRIYADDVQCQHGAATGQLEEQELFYLRSRGLSRDLARFLLTVGFTEEILVRMTSSKRLQDEIRWLIARELRRMAPSVP